MLGYEAMADQIKLDDVKIITIRPLNQKRDYSNYVEISSNPREVSLKFCDIKPPNSEELEEITKNKRIQTEVNTEVVLPLDVADGLLNALKTQIETIKENIEKEKNK